jgi:hypothetical protein
MGGAPSRSKFLVRKDKRVPDLVSGRCNRIPTFTPFPANGTQDALDRPTGAAFPLGNSEVVAARPGVPKVWTPTNDPLGTESPRCTVLLRAASENVTTSS